EGLSSPSALYYPALSIMRSKYVLRSTPAQRQWLFLISARVAKADATKPTGRSRATLLLIESMYGNAQTVAKRGQNIARNGSPNHRAERRDQRDVRVRDTV